jgi:hypothetical protein
MSSVVRMPVMSERLQREWADRLRANNLALIATMSATMTAVGALVVGAIRL